MELTIGWGTIAKLLLAGIGTYVLIPAFLVVRDWLLWKSIEKFILIDRLRALITMRANDVWYLNNKYNYQRQVKMGQDGSKYYLNDIEVSWEEFNNVNAAIEFHSNRADVAGTNIVWKSNLLNWLLRHYKQEGDSNPIVKWEKAANEKINRQMANKSRNTDGPIRHYLAKQFI